METIKRAAALLGGIPKLALAIRVSQQGIHRWASGITAPNSRYASRIQDATGGAVTAYEIGREADRIKADEP
jgi:DNA-binding transcriptional regulator YdaS (Cro superfamily)